MEINEFSHLVPELTYFVNRKCTPSWRIVEERINFHDLTYVRSGKSTYLVNGEEVHLTRGDFIYIPEGNVREAWTDPDDPMRCYAANFKLHTMAAREPEQSQTSGQIVRLPFEGVIRTGIDREYISLYEELDRLWVEKGYNYGMRARALLLQILDKLICRVSSGALQMEDARIFLVKQHILQFYMNRIELSELAELVGLNLVYLGALFKKTSGCTIKQYINRIRLNNAEYLLSTGGYSVSEAAARCSFDDIFYFSKAYKAYKGYSPSFVLKNVKA